MLRTVGVTRHIRTDAGHAEVELQLEFYEPTIYHDTFWIDDVGFLSPRVVEALCSDIVDAVVGGIECIACVIDVNLLADVSQGVIHFVLVA